MCLFNHRARTQTFPLSLHDALPIFVGGEAHEQRSFGDFLDKDGRYQRCDEFLEVVRRLWTGETVTLEGEHIRVDEAALDRKSTRLNSSHMSISYAVFCSKKKTTLLS